MTTALILDPLYSVDDVRRSDSYCRYLLHYYTPDTWIINSGGITAAFVKVLAAAHPIQVFRLAAGYVLVPNHR